MVSFAVLMAALSEQRLAQVGLSHDECRMRYPLRRNTVGTFAEFERLIGDYFAYHYCGCVAPGARLDPGDAAQMAKEVIEREYRRRHGDIVTAFNDANLNTNGGVRAICDLLCDALKTDAIERYIRRVFDRMVAPNCWDDKVLLIQQFIQQCGPMLGSAIRADQAERYAQSSIELIRAYVEALQRLSPTFRRL
jgi:hypothetical protein